MDKTFQVADWRIRPIPKRMLNYAKEDSSIVVYLFFLQLSLLLEKQLEYKVATSCNKTILRTIEKHNISLKVLIDLS
jgi:exosome complex exonuclease RRP6